MLDLKKKPFYLDEQGCQWVKETLAGMSQKEKVGQLFCEILWDRPDSKAANLFAEIEPGAVMYRPFSGKRMNEISRELQQRAKIPLLIACNLERGGAGGNGGLTDGTYVASPMGAAATDDPQQEYRLGLVAAREGAAAGINWTFEPIIDIDYNSENPITNVRTFGSDPERVVKMAKGYIDACREHEIAVTIKHFPGDGVDFRDQHLLTSVNSLSAEEWYETYGYVYKTLIDYGAQTVMSAHIMQPAVTRQINPAIADEEIMPASLSRELNQGVLRDRFGFNGVIVTDATQMVGFTCSMPRRLAVPTSIANGADMFLFSIHQREDVAYMLEGVQNGIISPQRLDEAVSRILALKASLRLHCKELVPPPEALQVLRCPEHLEWAAELASKSITLVKDKQQLLPLSPTRNKRIKLLQVTNERLAKGEYLPELQLFKKLLENEGFEVSFLHDHAVPGAQLSLADYRAQTDLILYYANMKVGSNQTTIRLMWDDFLGEDSPKYVLDIPTLFLSFSNPYHLVDVPMVRTYINAYTSNEFTVRAMVEKLMGREPFVGVSPVDPFGGLWDARL